MTDTPETPAEVTPPTWWIDENVPGQGDRPAWLSDKFKSAADLARSYGELEKRVGTAPDDYDFSKASWMDPDYVPFQELKELAKSKRVPSEVMDKVIDSMDKYMNEFTIDPSEEAKKLGENAKNRIETLNNWAKANFSDEAFSALTGTMRTAESIKALEEVRKKMMDNNTVIPGGNESATSNAHSLAEVQSELTNNLARYKTDKKYQAEIRLKMELASKNSTYVDKHEG